MPKKSSKSKSKRTTLHQKYKVLKKIKEHHKKKAKELKRKGSGRAAKPKDLGIPSSWPFKEQLMQEMAFAKERAEAALLARREAAKQRRAEKRKAGAMDEGDEEGDEEAEEEAAAGAAGAARLGGLAARASARADAFDAKPAPAAAADGGATLPDADRSRRAFYKEFVKVVDASDVVIQVLDARDPLACRSDEVERFVRSRGANKRLVLLLNKVDLVPRHAAEAWLKYLRQELPTVAFKCATGGAAAAGGGAGGAALPGGARGGAAAAQRGRPPARGAAAAAAPGAAAAGAWSAPAAAAGAELLVALLKNYARAGGRKTAITVGIVGLPNVGKSSLINSLVKSRAAATGATPGLTRASQEVALDRHVKLLDSPGIVFATRTGGDGASGEAALRGAIRLEKLDDPLPAVAALLARTPQATLCALYSVPSFAPGDANAFLRSVAARRGRLRRGGVPDALSAARAVLTDWTAGRIPFFTLPPARAGGEHERAEVVASFGPDFDAAADSIAAAVLRPGGGGGGAAEAGGGGGGYDEEEAAAMPCGGPLPHGALAVSPQPGDDGYVAPPQPTHAPAAMDEGDGGGGGGGGGGGAAMDEGEAGGAAAAAAAGAAPPPSKPHRDKARPQSAALYSEEGMQKPGAARQERRKAKRAARGGGGDGAAAAPAVRPAGRAAAGRGGGGGDGDGGGGDGSDYEWGAEKMAS